MEEWKEYKLEELSKGKGAYGIGASAVPFSENKFTYLRITDINDDGTLNKNGLMSVDDEDANKYVLCKNDIVFARTGNSTGRSYFYDGTDGILVYAGFLIKFSLDEKRVNPRILKYYTHSKPYYDWVKSFDTGGTRGNINAKTYGAMPILLPPHNVQDRIVEILKSLDDKIEVNRRINEQLEELAQALFKSWFVDFEPFKDGEFVESELGMIPKGWKVGTLDEVSKLIAGGDKPDIVSPNKTEGTQYPIYSNGIDNYGLYGFSDNYRIEEESVTISARGTIGYVCLREEPYTPIVRLISVIPILEYVSAKFLYHSLRIKQILGTGTTQQQLTVPMFRKTLLVIPPKDIVDSFTVKVNSMFALRKKNQQEITHLTNLRDTLLPKLMSGEIEVEQLNVIE